MIIPQYAEAPPNTEAKRTRSCCSDVLLFSLVTLIRCSQRVNKTFCSLRLLAGHLQLHFDDPRTQGMEILTGIEGMKHDISERKEGIAIDG
jgi:hypothetical protein